MAIVVFIEEKEEEELEEQNKNIYKSWLDYPIKVAKDLKFRMLETQTNTNTHTHIFIIILQITRRKLTKKS